MRLSVLLQPWLIEQKSFDCIIFDIKNDSRKIEPGDLFLAYPGTFADGRLFIDKALALGAVGIVYEPLNFPKDCILPQSIPCIAIPNLIKQLPAIAQRFYKNPTKSLMITGITGTNGKTTIAYQLAQAYHYLGIKSAYIGTLGHGKFNQLNPLQNTTPDAVCLYRLLSHYKKQEVKHICMEVSSHALNQHRVDTIDFKQAIFTNLTLDHLDYHHNMDAYAAAKALLFAYESLEYAIINQDAAYQYLMAQAVKKHVKKITYGLYDNCDVQAVKWKMTLSGTTIDIRSPWGQYSLAIKALGKFNIYNSLAILTSLLANGYEPNDIIAVLAQLNLAPGRMEIVAYSPYVVIDYAHTPDALENVLVTLKKFKKGRLWVVFGCGGDRDKSKRPLMGIAASLHADRIVITSDNPRSEDPELILDDIAKDIADTAKIIKLINREEAIKYALDSAEQEDIILIAGKGHEIYQHIGNTIYNFSDHSIVKSFFDSHSKKFTY